MKEKQKKQEEQEEQQLSIETEVTPFEKGGYLYSETLGVCKVSDIPKLSVNRRVTKTMDYYKLRPVSDLSKAAYIPVENHKVELRELISLEEANSYNEEELKEMPALKREEVRFVIERDKKIKERKALERLKRQQYREKSLAGEAEAAKVTEAAEVTEAAKVTEVSEVQERK
ncbi:MAG TPA: hypothetical protein DCG85_06335 [Lachnospiraceae bacterium]|nr:hypothetical protein [Lachnospiraceae bacterium]